MDPIRIGQSSALGGLQRTLGGQHAVGPTPSEPGAAPNPAAASVAGGVNELRSIGSRIADIERAGFQAMARRDQLEDTGKLLAELRGLVTEASKREAYSTQDRAAHQARFDEIIGHITRLEEGTPLAAQSPLSPTQSPGVTASNVSPSVDKFSFGAHLKPGESRDVSVEVLASAQVAGFFLSFGGDNLNLGGATEQFVIKVGGNAGTQELAFASGTSLSDIAAAINSFTASTGVIASVSGTSGVRLQSADYGSSQFVSVNVVDDGGIGTSANKGIYALQAKDADNADRSVAHTFAGASNTLKDKGQDLDATINGVHARSNGREIRARIDGDLWVDLVLSDNRGLTGPSALALGKFEALTLSRPAEARAPSGPSAADLDDARKRLDTLDQSERAAARARTETLAQLTAQMRGAVSSQTGADASHFNAAGAAAALRAGLLGQPAPTPPPPSGGIEPKRSVELLTDH